MCFILNFIVVKGSKYHVCVQPWKAHVADKERHLAPLELIHIDLYMIWCGNKELNGAIAPRSHGHLLLVILGRGFRCRATSRSRIVAGSLGFASSNF